MSSKNLQNSRPVTRVGNWESEKRTPSAQSKRENWEVDSNGSLLSLRSTAKNAAENVGNGSRTISKYVTVESKTFLMKTSMKGFGRCLRAEGYFLKFIWFLGIAGLFTFCGISVKTIVDTYTSYPKNTFIDEELINKRKLDGSENLDASFTANTICNLQPLASDFHIKVAQNNLPGIDKLLQYLGMVQMTSNVSVQTVLGNDGLLGGYLKFIGSYSVSVILILHNCQ